jgi:proline iminopeptidase
MDTALTAYRAGHADVGRGIALAYETYGAPEQPAIVLIMGLGMQLTAWPQALVRHLVDAGFHVVRFDNRDAGLSTQLDGRRGMALPMALVRARLGLSVAAPYLLHDLARDTVGLMDALGLDRAHVVGASMGGMVAQLVASGFAARVASLTLLMSHSGAANVAPPHWAAAAALLRRPPAHASVEQLVEHYFRLFRVIGSPPGPHRLADEVLRARLHATFSRAWRPAGTYRQLLAIVASGDRSALLRQLQVPTLVLHGAADPLVPPAAARDLADKIPGARLRLIEQLGHDLGAEALLAEEIGAMCIANRHPQQASERRP